MERTTLEKHNHLKTLGKQARRNVYNMLRLADEILQDHAYIDQHGGELAVMDAMEEDEFSHFGGDPELGVMLSAFRRVRDVIAKSQKRSAWSIWEEYHCNVRAIIELADYREPERRPRPAYKAELEEKQSEWNTERAELRSAINRASDETAKAKEEADRIRIEAEQKEKEAQTLVVVATEKIKTASEQIAEKNARIRELELEVEHLQARILELESLLDSQEAGA